MLCDLTKDKVLMRTQLVQCLSSVDSMTDKNIPNLCMVKTAAREGSANNVKQTGLKHAGYT